MPLPARARRRGELGPANSRSRCVLTTVVSCRGLPTRGAAGVGFEASARHRPAALPPASSLQPAGVPVDVPRPSASSAHGPVPAPLATCPNPTAAPPALPPASRSALGWAQAPSVRDCPGSLALTICGNVAVAAPLPTRTSSAFSWEAMVCAVKFSRQFSTGVFVKICFLLSFV